MRRRRAGGFRIVPCRDCTDRKARRAAAASSRKIRDEAKDDDKLTLAIAQLGIELAVRGMGPKT